ncbi:acyl transferase/acyl hydrolase/lysophospholipase [Cercophora samala]|uniref:Acyl transferase/acyl hydrolase/lysophospholipase n=1 Tax=Cercophora samala TaxID=330535 RepID=A0AA40DBI1_9PEZI|nr:acyl transferase/acyl hydrolase/lysophospholipase [Cercophora samala]
MNAVLEDISLQLRVLGLYHDQYFHNPQWNHNVTAGCLSSLIDEFNAMTLSNFYEIQGKGLKGFKRRVRGGLCALKEQTRKLDKTLRLLAGPEEDGGFPLPRTEISDHVLADGLTLLAIDGGGVRGLVSLRILKAIMDNINRANGTGKAKTPAECFKLAGGTSAGGLICIMLFRLGMSIDEALTSYKELSQTMFQPSFISKCLGGAYIRTMLGLSWYEGSLLEDVIREKVVAQGLDQNATLLNHGSGQETEGCQVFVTSVRSRDNFAVRFRSYKLPDGSLPPYNTATIVQAARATSAAPFYFPPATVGKTEFWDGALANNNPVDELWAEKSLVFSCWTKGPANKPAAKCVLSLGTGRVDPSRKKRSWIASHPAISKGAQLLESLTNVENVHRRFDQLMRAEGVWYFRFNPPTTEDVDLAEYREERLAGLEADVERYLKRPHIIVMVRLCAQLLR